VYPVCIFDPWRRAVFFEAPKANRMEHLFRNKTQLNGHFLGVYSVDDMPGSADGSDSVAADPAEKAPDSASIGPETVVLTPDPVDSAAPIDWIEVPRSVRLSVRCTPEALGWVKALAVHCSLDVTSLIWQSLIRQAENSGYYTQVPRRFVPKGSPAARPARPPSVF
jgi:hypothetical protein